MDAKTLAKEIQIRPITEHDEALVNSFFDAMSPASSGFFNRRDYNRRTTLRQCRKSEKDKLYWIATLEECMAGLVFFWDWNTGIPELGIAVRDDLQGKHLGRTLMEYALRRAKECGKGGFCLTTHIANVRAQVLYESFGFVCIGQTKNGTELFYMLRFPTEQ